MNDYIALKQLYREAVQNFPFPDLKKSRRAEGSLDDELEGDGTYSEDYSFTAGQLLDSNVQAKGCIEIMKEKNTLKIVALFWMSTLSWVLAKNPLEKTFIWGEYNLHRHSWSLRIEART